MRLKNCIHQKSVSIFQSLKCCFSSRTQWEKATCCLGKKYPLSLGERIWPCVQPQANYRAEMEDGVGAGAANELQHGIAKQCC